MNQHPGLNREDAYAIAAKLPLRDEQCNIARVLDCVENSIGLETAAMGNAQELKRAAMRELFKRGLRGEAQKETEIGLAPEMFDACVNGSEIRRKKPAPDIFLAAARKARIPPNAALVIEDAPNGVQAAHTAGMCVLGITSSFSAGMLSAAGADWTAPDLAQVPDSVWRIGCQMNDNL